MATNPHAGQSISGCLLQRIAAGDAAAVRDCMAQYGGLVWTLARRFSRTLADAEDATQEIFLHIWQLAGRFEPLKVSENIFIVMIARRRLIDRLRKMAPESVMTLRWADAGAGTHTSIGAKQLAHACTVLQPEQRQVLELGLLGGFTQVQIAARLGMTISSVKSHMRRGLFRVRRVVAE